VDRLALASQIRSRKLLDTVQSSLSLPIEEQSLRHSLGCQARIALTTGLGLPHHSISVTTFNI